MENKDKTIWGIHSGKGGVAESLFLQHDVIALGWSEMGDLSKLAPERDSFRKRLTEVYPGRKEGSYPVMTGQLFRFVHEMKKGDLVVFPSRSDKKVHFGEIVTDYKYDTTTDPSYPQRRTVKWLKSFPRSRFTQGALYEIGSAMSLFQIKNFADEFLSVLSGQPIAPEAHEDESISYVAEDIEQNTKDFILKVLSQEIKGHAFAEFVAHLLGIMGYQTRISPEGPDGGIDIIAHKDKLGFEPPIIKVQVKSTEGNIGDPIVSQLYGKVDKSEYGMVVTLGSFTNQAISFARNKSNLRLIDGDEVVNLILDNYEKFSSKYKGLLPLRKVYVPEALEEDSD